MGNRAANCSSESVDENPRSCWPQVLLGVVTAGPWAPGSSPFPQEAVQQASRHSSAVFPAELPQHFLSAGVCSSLPPVPGKLPHL